ncbi:MAG: chorismate synthase [Anaerolineae bacterium]|nr:chorismate synthase [Anaerolineae bacterium]
MIPPNGVALTRKLGELLGVAAGDVLRVEIKEGRRPVRAVQVTALVDELVGVSAYMELGELNHFMEEGPLISGAYLKVDFAALDALYRELRVALERASARETAMRVAVGAICRQLLGQFAVQVGGYVCAIGEVEAHLPDDLSYEERFRLAEASSVRCPDPQATEAIEEAIRQCKIDKDTLGGIIEVAVLGLPPGLGSHVHYDRRLTGLLLAAVGSVQSMKGAEVGPAYANARKRGTQVHDQMELGPEGRIQRRSNRAGGLEGGMTTGEPLVVRAFMKPISTTLTPLASVNLATGADGGTQYERSDFCATPRAVPIIEAVVAFVMANALLEKLGGDSIAEMQPRFALLRRNQLDALQMWDEPWRFGYSTDA